MKIIKLRGGSIALIDDEDFELVTAFKWGLHKRGKTSYAITTIRENKRSRTIYMHALIMNTPKGQETHHIDENGLNNQRANLQVVSRSEHAKLGNKRGPKPKLEQPSGTVPSIRPYIYPYLYSNKPLKYRAFLRAGPKLRHVGYFNTYEEAIIAAEAAAARSKPPAA